MDKIVNFIYYRSYVNTEIIDANLKEIRFVLIPILNEIDQAEERKTEFYNFKIGELSVSDFLIFRLFP